MDIALNRTLHIGFPNMSDTSMHDITTNIEAGSASISEILISSQNIKFGEYNANKFEVFIYGISDVSGEKIVVWVEEPAPINSTSVVGDAIIGDSIVGDDTIFESTVLFTGYVDSCKLDNFGYYRQIVAYDELAVKRNVSVSEWWNNFWTEDLTRVDGITLKTLRESVCDYVGIDYTTTAIFNDNLIIKPVVMTVGALRFADLLQMICELQCVFPNMNRQGILSYVDIISSSTKNIQTEYEHINSTFEDYVTNIITKLNIEQNGDILYSANSPTPAIVGIAVVKKTIAGLIDVPSIAQSETPNTYTLKDNLLIQSFTYGELGSFSNKYLAHIRNTPVYKPASVKMIVSDLNLKLGDKLVTDKGTTLVFDNELSGILLVEQTLGATGEQFYPETTNTDLSEQVYISKAIGTAVDLANSKNAIYYGDTAPEGDNFFVNDTWFKEESDGSSTMYTWDGYEWIQEQFGNEAIKNLSITNAKIADATIQSAKIASLDAGKITAGTLTGRRINNGNGTFLVTESGALTATSANITGTIHSTAGTIGGWTIGASSIYSDPSSSRRVTIANGTNSYGDVIVIRNGTSGNYTYPFVVHADGTVSCSNLTVTGGSISLGNTSISSTGYLSSSGANITGSTFGGSFSGTGAFSGNSSLAGSFSGYGAITSGYLAIDDSGQIIRINSGSSSAIINAGVFGAYSGSSYSLLTSNGVSSGSDKRLKTDIIDMDIETSANLIYSLIPKQYRYKTNTEIHHGFIAQDVQKVYNDKKWAIISTFTQEDEPDDIYLSLNYTELIADMVATIQSLNNRIKILEEKN